MSRSYPTETEARDTFTDDDFEAAISKLAADDKKDHVIMVSLLQSTFPDGKIPADVMHTFAALSEEIGNGATLRADYGGLEIVRTKTRTELEYDVLSSRRAAMWYTEDSPHYIPKDER